MTLAELYTALEAVENGPELVKTVKAEIAKVNSEAAGYRTGKNQAEARIEELTAKVDELTAKGTGDQSQVAKLQTQVDALTKKYEAAEQARKDELNKRIHSDIQQQTIAALTKGNAANPQEIAKILTQNIQVDENDGSYRFTDADGTTHSIEEGTASWLTANPWAVKNVSAGGAGSGGAGKSGHGYTVDDLKGMSVEEINSHWDDISKSMGTKG